MKCPNWIKIILGGIVGLLSYLWIPETDDERNAREKFTT